MTDVSKVKGCLSQWRELVILADGLLGWEKDFYPALIAAAVTLKFVFVWWWDPTLLTFISITGIMISLLDYAMPKILGTVFKPESWNGDKEARYERACNSLVHGFKYAEAGLAAYREAKKVKPVVHFAATVSGLFALAWIGNRINNFFLLYLVVLVVLMLPGLHRKGLLDKYLSQVTAKMAEAVKGKDALKKAE